MSTLVEGTISSNTYNTGYNSVWASLYDTDMQVPQIWGEIIKYYGPGVGVLEWLYMAGQIVQVAGPTKTLFEEGSFLKLVEVGAAGIPATGAPGADATFGLAAGEFTGTDTCYLSQNDAIIIPAEYLEVNGVAATKPYIFQITAVTAADGVLKAFTATPHNVLVEIVNAIPAGTEIMVTGGNYPNGVQSGTPKSAGWYHRTFACSTKKADWSMTGSVQSNERYYEKLRGGGTGVFTKATIEADLWLSKGINDDILLGDGITNTLTMNDRDGNAIQATGTVGLYQHMVDAAMKQYYTLAYSYPDFDDVKDLLISQGVTNRNVTFFMGSLLARQIENAGLDFIKEFSGGTDLMKTMDTIGVNFKAINKNGVYTVFKELPSLSDPVALGAAYFEDHFKGLGFIVPDTMVATRSSMDGEGGVIKLNNIALGYKNYNGENRTRINKIIQGMASVGGAASGNNAVDTFDDVRGSLLSEYMLIVLKRNQMILCQNDVVL